MNDERDPPPPLPPGMLVVRPGRGANCSSIGSVVDVLFGAGVVGGALVVALTAWLEGQEGPGEGAEAGDGAGPGGGGAEAGAGAGPGGGGAEGGGDASEA